MVSKTFNVIEDSGLHARPATVLVNTANKFSAELELKVEEKSVNLKSIMGVMSLGVAGGDVITISATGDDENEALEALNTVLVAEKIAE